MKNNFVTYEQALKLKLLGFDEDCLGRYEGKVNVFKPLVYGYIIANLPRVENKVGYPDYPYQDVEAPLKQQVFKWFRDKHKLSSWVYNSDINKFFYTILQNGRIVKAHKSFITYEEAESTCINKLIELIK